MQEVMVEVRKNWLSEELRIYLKLADEAAELSKTRTDGTEGIDGYWSGKATVYYFIIARLAITSKAFGLEYDNTDDFYQYGGIEELRGILNAGV